MLGAGRWPPPLATLVALALLVACSPCLGAQKVPDPPNGEIVRDPETGEPTGALKEAATALVERALPEPSPDERYAMLVDGLRHLTRLGITAVQDAAFSEADVPLLERALAEGALPLRVRGTVGTTTTRAGRAIAPTASTMACASSARSAALS